MSEPTLNQIEDYNGLKGEKRRIVYAVIIAGLIIGGIYTFARAMYNEPTDAIKIDQNIKKIPLR